MLSYWQTDQKWLIMHFTNCLLSRNSTALNQAMAESYPCFDQWQVHLGIFFSIRLLALNQLHSLEKKKRGGGRKKEINISWLNTFVFNSWVNQNANTCGNILMRITYFYFYADTLQLIFLHSASNKSQPNRCQTQVLVKHVYHCGTETG